MKKTITYFWATLLLGGSTSILFGFADSLTWKNRELLKAGESQVKVLSFLKIFDAALYLETSYETDDFPGDFSYALTLKYQRNIKRKTLIKSAEDILNDLHRREALLEIEDKLFQINQKYVDVSKGDTYTLIYDPGTGTTLLHNGKPRITIPGRAFAEIYFTIWLGGHPKSRQLQEDLLQS